METEVPPGTMAVVVSQTFKKARGPTRALALTFMGGGATSCRLGWEARIRDQTSPPKKGLFAGEIVLRCLSFSC